MKRAGSPGCVRLLGSETGRQSMTRLGALRWVRRRRRPIRPTSAPTWRSIKGRERRTRVSGRTASAEVAFHPAMCARRWTMGDVGLMGLRRPRSSVAGRRPVTLSSTGVVPEPAIMGGRRATRGRAMMGKPSALPANRRGRTSTTRMRPPPRMQNASGWISGTRPLPREPA